MRHFIALTVSLLSMSWLLLAKGTPAGTLIANQAQIDYTVGGIDGNLTSNTDAFVIDRIVDITIDWEDAATVEVAAGEDDRVLTFRLSNLGNGDENITLTYEHNTSSQFLPTGVRIYQDDGDGHFDPAKDTNLTLITLDADHNATLFLVGVIPDDNTTAPGRISYETLHADSESNATAGADRPTQIDVVVRQGADADTGSWMIREYWLSTEKNATVHTEDNATHTGSRITYTIETWIGGKAGNHSIGDVTIRDRIPEGTRYLPGTLRLDSTALTDKADGDAGESNTTDITVRVGTLSGATHRRVSFDVVVE